MTVTGSASALATVDQDILRILDHALPFVLIFKLSAAWLYPSFIPSDSAPGLALVNALFLGFCLYGTVRLLFTHPLALFLAEPSYFLLLLVATLTLVYSVSPANSFGMLRTAALFFGACLFIRYRFSPAHILQLFAVSMGVLLAVSIVAALMTPLGTMGGFDAGRWRGVFNHKNTLGENAAATLIVALGLLATSKPRSPLLLTIGLLALVCLAMAGSATAVALVAIALLVGGTTLAIIGLRIQRSQGLWLLLVLLVVFIATGLASVTLATQYLGRDLTFTGRTQIWEQFFAFAEQRPWTGWGWATISTSDAMLPIIRQTLGLPYIQTPHNGYLSILVELGRPGLALFVIWLLATAFAASRAAMHARNSIALIRLALVCGLIFHSMFESTSGALPSLWLFVLLSTNKRLKVHW